MFLASLGYQLSAVEQAVADGVPYTGEDTPGGPGSDDATDDVGTGDSVATDEPAAGTDSTDPGSGQTGNDTGTADAGDAELPDRPGDYPGEAVA